MASSSKQERDGVVNIMMSANDSYVAPLCVSVLSLLKNFCRDKKVCLYIIDFNISKNNKTKLEESLKEYISNEAIEISYVPVHDKKCMNPTYGRLIGMVDFIQSTESPAQYVYLDADTIIRHDISELWDQCRSQLKTVENGVFAVQDFGYPNGHDRLKDASILFQENGFKAQKNISYYNAGVFFIDLNKIEQSIKTMLKKHLTKLIEISQEVDEEKQPKVPFADQDILNLFFDINPLDKKWNVQGIGSYMKDRCRHQHEFFPKLFTVQEYNELVEDPYIVHFTGSDRASAYYNLPGKPWNPMCQNPFKHEFLKYKDETEFKDDSISNVNDMRTNMINNRELLKFIHGLNRTAKNNPEAFSINFHFVRHGERQAFYPEGDGVNWSSEHILNKDRLHDDALTGLGKRMARNAGKKILKSLDDKENQAVVIFTSPFVRCVETAVEIHDVIRQKATNVKVRDVFVDKGLCEYLKEDWFGSTMKTMNTSTLEELYLDVTNLATELKKISSKDVTLKEYSILPQNYQLQFESDSNQDRFRVMASQILEMANEYFGVDAGKDKVTDVVFVSHGGVLNWIVQNMFKLARSNEALPDLGHISYAHHCHLKYNYLLSELALVSPFTTPTEITSEHNWNDAVVGEWKRIFKMITKHEETNVNVLEIGSWEGLSATRFLSMIKDCNLWCVDHFDELKSEAGKERLRKFLYNIRATGKRQNVKLLIGYSVPALITLLQTGIKFDFSYIDGSHRSDDTYLDAEMVWRMSKRDSLMLFDDYQWPIMSPELPDNPVSMDDIEHPKKGIDAFMEVHKNELEVVYNGYQVCVKKKTEPRLGFPIGGEVSFIPMMSLLNKENMMKEDEEQLVEYMFEHVQKQITNQKNILIFDFSQ